MNDKVEAILKDLEAKAVDVVEGMGTEAEAVKYLRRAVLERRLLTSLTPGEWLALEELWHRLAGGRPRVRIERLPELALPAGRSTWF